MKSELYMCATNVPVPEAHLGIPMHSLCLVLNGSNAMIVASPNMVLGLSQVLGLAEQHESFLQEISTDWETENRLYNKTQVQTKQPSAGVCQTQKIAPFGVPESVCRTSCYSMTDMVTGQTVNASGVNAAGVNANNAAANDTRLFWAILGSLGLLCFLHTVFHVKTHHCNGKS